MSAYVHNEQQGREHLSHPAWTGKWGRLALDWAWEDRARTPAAYDPAAREQDVAVRFWEHVLTPGTCIHEVLSEGAKEGNLMHLLQSLYLFGREKWRPGFTPHAGGPGVVDAATFNTAQ